MSANYTYPGVYVEEIPSGARTLVGVSTSNTAFVDFFKKGPTDRAVKITSYGDFERMFGGLDKRSEASYAIKQYYLNGGSIGWVVRVLKGGTAATLKLKSAKENGKDVLGVTASSKGKWGDNVQVAVDHNVPKELTKAFNLVVREVEKCNGEDVIVRQEVFRNLTMGKDDTCFAESVINGTSEMVTVKDARDDAGKTAGLIPVATGTDVVDSPKKTDFKALGTNGTKGNDGNAPGSEDWIKSTEQFGKPGKDQSDTTGMYLLNYIVPEVFNILCIPAAADLNEANMKSLYEAAVAYCVKKRAFMVVDMPRGESSISKATDWLKKSKGPAASRNAAIYFPRLKMSDPLNDGRMRDVGPSGTIAGVYARTDATLGVWKAPAGTDASLRGVQLTVPMTDLENGTLNPRAINALRSFPTFGKVSWGARTMKGDDMMADEYKYIPVRRLALYIEESLYQGLHWAVFAPNDEPLWAEIRLAGGSFMHNLFRKGAFQGGSPKDAYYVKCDKETTTQNDIDLGIVNIHVGFAPLKPAEFVVIKLQQIAGQTAV